MIRDFLPHREDYELGSWKYDVLAGISVGVVALPLALAFGITSGMSAASGLVTAIVAGLIAAIFGGSKFQVSGPTGAMTVVLVPIVAKYGSGAIPVVGLIAGILIILLAIFRLGSLISAIPWPVIEGFTVGIAIVIGLQQVPLLLDVSQHQGSNAAEVALSSLSSPVNKYALLTGLLSMAALLILSRLHARIPSSIVVVIVGTVAVAASGWTMASVGEIPNELPLPTLPNLTPTVLSDLFSAGLAVMALGAIESLLSARVADGLANTAKRHEPNRELFGQGLASIFASIMGGMPATGAIARTAVNVKSGARTRLSSIVHAIFLLLVVLFAGDLVRRIPIPVLAGILVATAIRMINLGNIRLVLKSTKTDAVIMLITASITVFLDLILAVEIGLLLAAVTALRQFSRSAQIKKVELDDLSSDEERLLFHEHIVVYRLEGALFFGAAHHYFHYLSEIRGVKVVILRMSSINVIDGSGAQALLEIVKELNQGDISVVFEGLNSDVRTVLDRVLGDFNTVDRFVDAMNLARSLSRGSS